MPVVSSVRVRYLMKTDLPQVVDIETQSFASAWNLDDFLTALRSNKAMGLVAADAGDRVLGFAVVELLKHRVHVLGLAVRPGSRRMGIGAQLMASVLGKMRLPDRVRTTVPVRESNLGAQLFFRAQGFRAEKILNGYFEDTGEDGYWFAYERPDLNDPRR